MHIMYYKKQTQKETLPYIFVSKLTQKKEIEKKSNRLIILIFITNFNNVL